MSTTGIRLLSGGGSLGSVPMPSSTVRCADPPHPDVSDKAETVHILKSNRLVLRIGVSSSQCPSKLHATAVAVSATQTPKIARSGSAQRLPTRGGAGLVCGLQRTGGMPRLEERTGAAS